MIEVPEAQQVFRDSWMGGIESYLVGLRGRAIMLRLYFCNYVQYTLRLLLLSYRKINGNFKA